LYLATLNVSHFRNIAHADLAFSPGINLLVGENGAGKTALLEAVHLLARGRSFRTPQAKQLIRHNEKELLVRGEVSSSVTSHQLARSKSSTGVNEARIDGQSVNRQSRYAELLPLQTLLPGIGDLVLDGPAIRREFVDWGLFHVEQSYLVTAQRFRKALTQRAAWLKEGPSEDFSMDPWVATLARAGAEISTWRHRFVDALNAQFQQTLVRMQANFSCDLHYQGSGFSEEEALAQLAASFERDKRYATTHVGPHRADVDIRVDGVTAKTIVSRGQAKLIASSIVLSYAAELAVRSGAQPILLLDDFGAELDESHRERFFAELRSLGCQVIATTTDQPEHLVGASSLDTMRVFHVEHGSVTQNS
jgi:DNA replication and repair protein RecF